jgi:hypothetical protein
VTGLTRQQRRALERRLASEANEFAHPVPASIVLEGGPMDGWVVKADAPALAPDWYTTWPPSIAARNEPGRYLEPRPVGGLIRATWSANA